MKYLSKLALLALLATATAAAQMAAPIPLTAAQFAATPSGQSVTLAARVNSLRRTSLDVQLLERINDSTYKTTTQSVTLYLPAETPIVMGSIADLRPGAVVFVYGIATNAHHADVKKVTVITPFVKVQ
jgi:hypothetical protein